VNRTPIPIYYCPSRRPPDPINNEAKVDYAGCAGSNGLNGMLVRTGLPPIKLLDVVDGLSNTLMIGEKQLNPYRFGLTYDDNEPYNAPGWDSEIFRVGGPSAPPGHDSRHPSFTSSDPDAGSNRFGSSHTTGFHACLGDGSVRHIKYSVSLEVFRRLCVRNDLREFSHEDL